MAIDTFNSLRVDLQDIFDEIELQTKYHSRMVEDDDLAEKIVICSDDYPLILRFAEEGASIIADAANYVSKTTQTGLEALTANFTVEAPNACDELDVKDLDNDQKQTGELLVKEEMDTIQFNVTQLEGIDPKKYTIIQGYIRSALIHYVLYKWYQLNKILDAMKLNLGEFENFKGKVRINSISNKKSLRAKKPVSYF